MGEELNFISTSPSLAENQREERLFYPNPNLSLGLVPYGPFTVEYVGVVCRKMMYRLLIQCTSECEFHFWKFYKKHSYQVVYWVIFVIQDML